MPMRKPEPTDHPWRAPLVPVALATTAGIALDRLLGLSPVGCLALAAACLIGWPWAERTKAPRAALVLLWIGVVGLGAAWHHASRHGISPDDIGQLVRDEPQLVALRGVVLEPPQYRKPAKPDPLRSIPARGTAHVVLRAGAVKQNDRWVAVSGKVRLSTSESLEHLRAGDEIEVTGRLLAPEGPGNPGEFDYASYLQDQQVRALLVVKEAGRATRARGEAAGLATGAVLQEVRSWAGQVIAYWLPRHRDLGRALLLGEQEALEQEQWDRYQRTGVVHVLAVSGQHLVVLAGFLALVLRACQVPRRRSVLAIPMLLLCYSLLTGWRPPVRRAFFMVGAFYGGFWLRRPVLPANAFALAWLLVCAFDPASIFYAGCQLSFLASGVLLWGTDLFRPRPKDALEELLDEQRPLWQKVSRAAVAKGLALFGANAAVWLAVSPLIAAYFHLVCPAGLVLGVPVLLLTSLGLVSGFLMLVLSLLCLPVAAPFAWFTGWCLDGCEVLLAWADVLPGAFWYVPDPPPWWLLCFYLALGAVLAFPYFRQRWRVVMPVLLLWLCVGLALPLVRPAPGTFRCTFLAVGHGSCVVLEMPDGRTLLYDAGAITGPDVTRRVIAPYLWSRGIARLDEVFLSHADLDHFNGMAALLERFSVGQVRCTPSFTERNLPGVQLTLRLLEAKGVPVRVLHAGDRLAVAEVEFHVLHPPAAGPEGRENFRSLVLLVRHLDHAVLLSGDLEGPGQDLLLSLPELPVDVLMAPHHGSVAANTEALAKWAAPRVVISSQGQPRAAADWENPYTARGAVYLTTWREGAVTVESGPRGLTVTTFRTGQRLQVR